MDPSARIEDLLSEYDRRNAAGTPATPEDLCRDYPELLPDLKRHLAALRRVPSTLSGTNLPDAEPDLPARVAAAVQYEVLRHHARGGLGEVLVARDPVLGREVAVKRVRPPLDADPDRRARFLREAELTGRLEHPGIVPVYALGRDDAGRPCYAMRLVRGDTLRDAIRAYHHGGGGAVAFRDLLGRFVAVCQAAAYAHGRGVVHRDIKPANVIIGPFGETILLDWGLAAAKGGAEGTKGEGKPLPGSDSFATPSPAGLTTTGAVMGTPGYMAPEQARGEPVGPAADVFSLGATLFTLLTDRVAGEPGPPRPAPAALLAVAARAMAPRTEDRYPSALALADDVARWLADEPVSAYRDPLPERLARWGRRNRPLVRAAAAALVVCVAVLAVAAVFLKRAGDRERAAAETATRRKAESDANYARARQAVDDLFVAVAEGKLKTVPGAQPVRKDLLRLALKYYQEFLAERADDPANREAIAATYTKVAMIVGEVETAAAAVGWHEKAVGGWRELVAANPDRADYRKELAGALDLHGLHLSRLNRLDDALKVQEEAVSLIDGLLAAEPDNIDYAGFLSRALTNLSFTQGTLGRNADAIRTGERGIAVDEMIARRQPDNLVVRRNMAAKWSNLGLDLNDLGRTDDAIRALEAACRISEEVVARWDSLAEKPAKLPDAIGNPHAGLAQSELNLAVALAGDERFPEARRRYLAAAERCRALVAADPAARRFGELALSAEANAVWAGLYLDVPAAELLPEAERACATGAKLSAGDPSNPTYRARLGFAHAVRGAVLARLGRADDAHDAWASAEGCFDPAHEKNATIRLNRSAAWEMRALALLALKDAPGVAAATQTMLDLKPDSAAAHVFAARYFAGCAKIAPPADRTQYEDRAIAALKKGVEKGYKKFDLLRTDPWLEPLRGREEFRALLAAGR